MTPPSNRAFADREGLAPGQLGHGGESMVRRVYGHLGAVRHRSTVVEYRVHQHRKVLGDRLRGLISSSAQR